MRRTARAEYIVQAWNPESDSWEDISGPLPSLARAETFRDRYVEKVVRHQHPLDRGPETRIMIEEEERKAAVEPDRRIASELRIIAAGLERLSTLPALHPDLYHAIKDFETVQRKYGDRGAFDTEPRGVFMEILQQAARGEQYVIPDTPEEWQLFTHNATPGQQRRNEAAVRALNSALRRILGMIEAEEDGYFLDALSKWFGW